MNFGLHRIKCGMNGSHLSFKNWRKTYEQFFLFKHKLRKDDHDLEIDGKSMTLHYLSDGNHLIYASDSPVGFITNRMLYKLEKTSKKIEDYLNWYLDGLKKMDNKLLCMEDLEKTLPD